MAKSCRQLIECVAVNNQPLSAHLTALWPVDVLVPLSIEWNTGDSL